VNALIGDKLSTAGEDRLACRKVKNGRSQPIGMHLWVAFDKRYDTRWFLRKRIARRMNEVTADIHQRATAAFDLIANVRRIDIKIAEISNNRAEFADMAFAEKLAEPKPLRIAANHEGFADLHSRASANGKQSFSFRYGKAKRFLAENMLASLGSFDGPGNMELIGKRIVDCVDIGIGK